MRLEAHWSRSTWTILDQGVVSLGAFLLNIVLARNLPPAEYGMFALIIGSLLLVQLTASSLIFYPMSIRSTVLPDAERRKLVGRGIVLLGLLGLPLILLIGAVLIAMGRTDLVLPLLTFFVVGQMQEALRRGLFAEFRHRDALIGDVIGYLGQVALVLALLQRSPATLADVFNAMSLAMAAALIVSYRLVGPDFRELGALRTMIADFWSLGSWSLANNLTGVLRLQIFFWGLAALHGAAATASYQAALNIINLANPILIGLCNVIPQTAARRFQDGYGVAWQAARPYAVAGALPILLCYGILLVVPEFVLGVIYGPDSAYADLALPIRILAVAALLAYSADMVCSYMHGVDAARLALLINLLGTIAAAALFLPLAVSHAVVGCCIALAVASLVRLVASQWILSRMIADGRTPVA